MTDPPPFHPFLDQTGWVTAVQSTAMFPSHSDEKTLDLVGAVGEGLDPRLGDGTDLPLPSLSEMEEPQWPIPDPTVSYPVPNLN